MRVTFNIINMYADITSGAVHIVVHSSNPTNNNTNIRKSLLCVDDCACVTGNQYSVMHIVKTGLKLSFGLFIDTGFSEGIWCHV